MDILLLLPFFLVLFLWSFGFDLAITCSKLSATDCGKNTEKQGKGGFSQLFRAFIVLIFNLLVFYLAHGVL